jgi:mannose-1-phosphate guanylyltransferase
MQAPKSHRYAVVVAGGSGTRLWPLSRRNLPKQMQKFISDKTLIDETVDRLTGVVPEENIYISTSGNYAAKIKELLPNIPAENIIIEPVARGTTSAFALFATTIYRQDPEATIYSLASDHAVTGSEEFQTTIAETFDYIDANPNYIALIGIKPDKPDTGLGYVKTDQLIQEKPAVYSVEKFIEKPSQQVAQTYLETDEYYWNAAYYCFKAKTLIDAYQDADAMITKRIDAYLDTDNADEFMNVPIKAQEIEFIDSKKFPLALIPADFKWSDIGNWQALHLLLSEFDSTDVVHQGDADHHIDINSQNCLVFSTDGRLIATVGLDNVVVVSTKDALLVLNKDQTQDIKKLLESLKAKGLSEYL